MRRRTFLAATAATTLALPGAIRAASKKVLKFVPQADLAVLDPILTTAGVTRSHGYLVFDTLYGMTGPEGGFKAVPQMAAGHRVEDDSRTWQVTLRDNLGFHDGQKVLARDCVASIRRWGARDPLGQALMARTDELSATDDKTITFRLKRPFPLLPDALGKATPNICAIMPERLASTDPYKQITEMVGSGPYRFKADERVQGSRFVYERFAGYQSRDNGEADWTSGPKVAHFERIEWLIIPDAATAAAALQSDEVDWKVSRDLLAAGYRGERVVLMAPQDVPNQKAMSEIAADTMRRVGMDVDYQAVDWGTILQRRASKSPPSQGGWNAFCTRFWGSEFFSPAAHSPLRGNGAQAWFGWPSSPKIEALREQWFDAPNLGTQETLAAQIQGQAFEDVPYYPLGLYYNPTAYRADLIGVVNGGPFFWNVRRT